MTVSILFMENNMIVPPTPKKKKTKSRAIYAQAIPLLGVDPKETESQAEEISSCLFLLQHLTIAKIRSPPHGPLTDKYKSMAYMHNGIQRYSSAKRKEKPFAGKWVELVDFMLSGKGQTQRDKAPCVLSLICESLRGKKASLNVEW